MSPPTPHLGDTEKNIYDQNVDDKHAAMPKQTGIKLLNLLLVICLVVSALVGASVCMHCIALSLSRWVASYHLAHPSLYIMFL